MCHTNEVGLIPFFSRAYAITFFRSFELGGGLFSLVDIYIPHFVDTLVSFCLLFC